MNFFNFFKKSVVLHCYTDKPDVYNFAAIKESKNFIPDWWKKTPKIYQEYVGRFLNTDAATIKSCTGFIELYRQGVMMPMWSDCFVMVGEIGSNTFQYEFSNKYSSVDIHTQNQRGGQYPEEQYLHVKFVSEWTLTCEEDVNFLFTAPIWNHDAPENLTILPGVLNFKYQHSSNINVLFKREKTSIKYLIPFGVPMVHLIPLTERKLIVKTHLVSTEELKRIQSISVNNKFTGYYKNNKDILKAKKCPFSHKIES